MESGDSRTTSSVSIRDAVHEHLVFEARDTLRWEVVLCEAGRLKALRPEDYAPRKRRQPLTLQYMLFSSLDAI